MHLVAGPPAPAARPPGRAAVALLQLPDRQAQAGEVGQDPQQVQHVMTVRTLNMDILPELGPGQVYLHQRAGGLQYQSV